MSANGNGHQWSKFWWGDWQNDKALQGCSLGARGLWIEILAVCHASERPGYFLINGMPPTVQEMADMFGKTKPSEVSKFLDELCRRKIYSLENGVIYCRRMVRDADASAKGREAVERRWKTNGLDHDPPQGPITPPNRSPNTQPTTPPNRSPIRQPNTKKLEAEAEAERRKEEPPKSPADRGGRVFDPALFEEFWELYPRKVGKRTAETAFAAAVNRGNEPETIIAGLRAHKFHHDPQFQPHPTTWLRGDRWLDEVDSFDPVLRAVGLRPEDFLDVPPGGLLQ